MFSVNVGFRLEWLDRHLAHPTACDHLDPMDYQLGRGVFLVRPHKKHVMTWDSRRYRIPILLGAVLFTPWTGKVLGEKPLWQFGSPGIYVMAGLTLAGISFTWWARIHLGHFWSNAITHKEGHRVIDTGPYGLVRHPIYTGLIAGMLATGVAVGTVTAMLGAVLISLGMWQKARMEEGFLTVELGAEAVRIVLPAGSDVDPVPAAPLTLQGLHSSFRAPSPGSSVDRATRAGAG